MQIFKSNIFTPIGTRNTIKKKLYIMLILFSLIDVKSKKLINSCVKFD